MARLGIRKSAARQIGAWLGIPLVKSTKTRRQEFLEIKRELLEHIRDLQRKENAELRKASWELEKAFALEKAGGKPREKATDGTIRTWSDGKRYRRVAPGKWLRVYNETESKGVQRSLKWFSKRINEIDDERELMWFVNHYKSRFVDDRGYPLPVVERLAELGHDQHELVVKQNATKNFERLEKEVLERENFGQQVEDMKARVDKYLAEPHTVDELKALQKETQALQDDIRVINDSLNNNSKTLSKLGRRIMALNNRIIGAIDDAEDTTEGVYVS